MFVLLIFFLFLSRNLMLIGSLFCESSSFMFLRCVNVCFLLLVLLCV